VASILPFIRAHDGSFEPEVIRAMGQAFDAVRNGSNGNAQPVHHGIAARIIDAARQGERDPERLKQAGLAAVYL
jgi:hypothetical protein